MKKFAMLMLCLVLVFALAACAGTDTTPQGSVSDTVTVTDMKGEVAIPANPQRIVDVAGLTEELLILDMKVIASANTSMFDGVSVPKHLATLFAERGIEVVGNYRGLTLELSFDSFSQEYRLTMIGQLRHVVTLGTDVFGNIQRMDNLLEALPLKEQACREKLSDLHNQLETAKVEVQKPFPREEELKTKLARLEELNTLLNMDKHEPEVIGDTEMPKEQPPARKTTELER